MSHSAGKKPGGVAMIAMVDWDCQIYSKVYRMIVLFYKQCHTTPFLRVHIQAEMTGEATGDHRTEKEKIL